MGGQRCCELRQWEHGRGVGGGSGRWEWVEGGRWERASEREGRNGIGLWMQGHEG